ncbi:50S ribosomal protein L13 [archaeon]|jgi:large subunit ribosomal protein L13|nr:50S ribosomal protein L13 [archaeon]MBT6698418.1 50S ribosomal protein L13 [archaeon]
MKVYNAKGMLIGRMASRIAKDALLGEEVRVINCDLAVVSGKKRVIQKEKTQRQDRRGYPGLANKRPRMPDRYVRRAIRGMLPWTTPRGKAAFARIMCYVGEPSDIDSSSAIILKDADKSKLPQGKYLTVAQIIKHLGGREY